MPFPKPPANKVFRYIVNDFETAWDSVAARKGNKLGRGNFMFALLSMTLLEFACRVCDQDPVKKKLRDLTDAIQAIDSRYFTPLPGSCNLPNEYPFPGTSSQFHLLAMMFDLVRNGKAHQYYSAVVTLSDGEVDMDLTGALPGRGLKRRRRRSPEHLRYKITAANDLSLYIRTDQLFLDLKKAIIKSKILMGAGPVIAVARPKLKLPKIAGVPGPHYAFKVVEVEAVLKSAGHPKGTW